MATAAKSPGRPVKADPVVKHLRILVTAKERDYLEQRTRETGASISEIVRRAINAARQREVAA